MADEELKAIKREELKAIMRAVWIGTAAEIAASLFVGWGLFQGASHISQDLSVRFSINRTITTAILLISFLVAVVAIIWSFSRKQRTWADNLKNMMPLDKFINSKDSLLGPNLDEGERETIMGHLQTILSRKDVISITVGLLPEEGNISDRILIKTYASTEELAGWSDLLGKEYGVVSTYRYKVKNIKQKVRSVLFIWD